MRVISDRSLFLCLVHWNLLRKLFPNLARGLKGRLGSTTRALPGMTEAGLSSSGSPIRT